MSPSLPDGPVSDGLDAAFDVVRATALGVAGALTTLVTLAAVAAVLIPRFPSIAAVIAGQPLRSAAPWWRDAPSRKRLRSRLARELRLTQSGIDMTTAQLAFRVLQPTPAGIPYRSPDIAELHALVTDAVAPSRRGVLVHFLAAEVWAANRDRLVSLQAYLEQFLHLRTPEVGDLREMEGLPGVQFSGFASAFSGATVLVDSAQVQGGCGAGVVVMHCAAWEGGGSHAAERSTRESASPYARRHDVGAHLTLPGLSERKVGQYDGSIPTLAGVELVEYDGVSGARFALTTRETCYVETEPPQGGRRGADGTHAKGLLPAMTDPRMSRFRPARDGALAFVPSASGTDRRVVQLNVVLGVVCRTPDPDSGGALVFARRSNAPRNAAGGLGPASGGVIELAVRDWPRDSDRFGAVDPLAGVLREAREELGVLDGELHATPRAVFLSTVRNRPLRVGRLNTGQLVATVLYLAGTTLTFEELQERAVLADPVEGAFESDGLVPVDLGGDAATFATNLATVVDELEQSALLTALYASAWIHQPAPTIAAFARAFEPWWVAPWTAPVTGGEARLCRQPGAWLADDRPGPGGTSPAADLTQEQVARFWPHLDAAGLVARFADRLRDEGEPPPAGP